MHEVKIQSSLGYERVWNSLASLDPFPLALFVGTEKRPSISRLRSDILPSYRIDWTEGRKNYWLIVAVTNLDFLNSTITVEITDGFIKSFDSLRFTLNLEGKEDGCEITISYEARFHVLSGIVPILARRKLKKMLLAFNFEDAFMQESRLSNLFD